MMVMMVRRKRRRLMRIMRMTETVTEDEAAEHCEG